MAAGSITWTAIGRLLHPAPWKGLGIGIVLSTAASLINFGVAYVLSAGG